MDSKINETVQKYFWVMDGTTPVAGLSELDFETRNYHNAAVSTVEVHIFEVDSVNDPGLYRVAMVPDEIGSWFFHVAHATYSTKPDLVMVEVRVLNYTNDELFEVLTQVPPSNVILVGTDYGGIDNLRYVDLQGTGIQDASVSAYLANDYDDGNLGGSYVKATTRTDVDGRFSAPLPLSPGYTYKLTYVYGGRTADVKEVYVSSEG